MQLCKVRTARGAVEVGVYESGTVRFLDLSGVPGP
jgi:hypothetical protein